MPAVLALLFAAAAAAGSLYLSLGLGLVACPLCFYQRAFALALVGLLGVGLLLPGRDPGRLCLLALPPAVAGLGVSAFHTYLVAGGKLECPAGIADLGPAPAQSLAVFLLITLAVLAGVVGAVRADRKAVPAAVAGLLLGLVAAWGSVAANPKMPDPPTAPYPTDQKVVTCRPPYRG